MVRSAIDCGETDPSGHEGGGPGGKRLDENHAWRQGNTAESWVGDGAITVASLAQTPALAGEQ